MNTAQHTPGPQEEWRAKRGATGKWLVEGFSAKGCRIIVSGLSQEDAELIAAAPETARELEKHKGLLRDLRTEHSCTRQEKEIAARERDELKISCEVISKDAVMWAEKAGKAEAQRNELLAALEFVQKYAAMKEQKGDRAAMLPSQLVDAVNAAITSAESKS